MQQKLNSCYKGSVKKSKWYSNPVFPLVPIFWHREPDEHNTAGFQFTWLIFRFWTLDAVDIEISFCISSHWGIGFNGLLPYLRWVIAIPFPIKFSYWVQRNLWRKPLHLRHHEKNKIQKTT